jgi:hypothetical protein
MGGGEAVQRGQWHGDAGFVEAVIGDVAAGGEGIGLEGDVALALAQGGAGDGHVGQAIEAQVVSGVGRAYGLELFARKQSGKTTGWLSYALSKSERKADYINNGEWYSFRFDRRHYMSLVVNHELNSRISLGANFVYATGEAYTEASQRYQILGSSQPSIYYGARNGARLPDYHRMDISVTINRKKMPNIKYKNESNWVISIYNVYGRKNAYTLSYENDKNGNPIIQKWYLFTFVPSVTYNFKF